MAESIGSNSFEMANPTAASGLGADMNLGADLNLTGALGDANASLGRYVEHFWLLILLRSGSEPQRRFKR